MNETQTVRISKFLSKHLRHAPGAIGVTLDSGGWVNVDDLLRACAQHKMAITRDELNEVVQNNNKQRFGLDETGERIRARQGHSVDVDLELAPAVPPQILFHGTGAQTVQVILAGGLQKMRRHHVHLSADRQTAQTVGGRHGRPVIFTVLSGAMHEAGHVFYQSDNGVWLTNVVPPQFLREEPS